MYYNPDYDGVQHNNEGWICPRCGRVNAPWLPYCSCDDIAVDITTTGTPYRIYPSSYSTAKTSTAKTGNEDYTVTRKRYPSTPTDEDVKMDYENFVPRCYSY